MEIYLIRHTKVDVPANICYGQSDVSLADSFEEETNTILKKISNSNNFILYSSPLIRCKFLANKIHGSQINLDSRLMELNFGDWELKTWDEIGKVQFDIWHSNFVYNKVPNGESYFELFERVVAFWEEIILKKENFILITHGGVIRALLAYILGLPLENSFRLKIDYGRITKITLSDTFYTIEYIGV